MDREYRGGGGTAVQHGRRMCDSVRDRCGIDRVRVIAQEGVKRIDSVTHLLSPVRN